jgi:hypothetical protein
VSEFKFSLFKSSTFVFRNLYQLFIIYYWIVQLEPSFAHCYLCYAMCLTYLPSILCVTDKPLYRGKCVKISSIGNTSAFKTSRSISYLAMPLTEFKFYLFKSSTFVFGNVPLLFQPMLMLGITVGVALSVIFPYWLITVLIIILFIGFLLCHTVHFNHHFLVS